MRTMKELHAILRHSPLGAFASTEMASACAETRGRLGTANLGIATALGEAGYGKWKDGLLGRYAKRPHCLFDAFFSNRAFSSEIVTRTDSQPLDGARAALVSFLSFRLQSTLLDYMASIPNAKVINAEGHPDGVGFERAFRFVAASNTVRALERAEEERNHFELMALELLGAPDGGETKFSFRADNYAFEFEAHFETCLLGLNRAPNGFVNSLLSGSAVSAGSLIRSYLEALLFGSDMKSWHDGKSPVAATSWEEALAERTRQGVLDEQHRRWVSETYSLLSVILHSGASLTYGEAWLLGDIVDNIKNAIHGSPGAA